MTIRLLHGDALTVLSGARRKRSPRRIVRRFCEAEDAILTDLRCAGYSLRALAAVLGRRMSSVQMRLDTLAKRDDGW